MRRRGGQPVPRPVLAIAVLVAVVLVGFASGYGYHRDELYFLIAGDHLAWSYPDQGPVVPLLAHLMSGLAHDSLTALRTPSALMAAGCVLASSLITREFGGSRRAQIIAAGCTAASPVVLSIGHLLSTSTVDLLAWSVITWLISRAIRTGDRWLWPVAGAVAGVALLNKPLLALLLFSLAVGIAISGPREVLRDPFVWAAGAIALAMWAPWLVWQAGHAWPQLHISSAIARGGSSTSQPRWALVPFQFLLAGPPLAPVWVAGLITLARSPRLREFRFFAVGWFVLAVVLEVAGGKPYYLAGLLPLLFAAGATSVDGWLSRGRHRPRRDLLLGALLASAAASALIALPLLQTRDAGLAVAMNADVGETIGWPQFAAEVAAAYAEAPHPAVIFTENYGEAGAIDRFGPGFGLPSAYSGHNGFGEWGPPGETERAVVVIGVPRSVLLTYFRGCAPAGRISNSDGIDNEENGARITLCRSPRGSWAAVWPHLRHLS